MELSNIEDILDNTEDDEEITNMRELTEEQMWGFFIEGFLLVSFLLQIIFSHDSLKAFVGLVGLVGNTLCLLCFSLKKNKSNFHYLMLATAIFDILYIFSASTLFSVPHIIPRFTHFCWTPVLGQGLGVNFTFAWDNNNENDNNDNDKNTHLNFLKETVFGDKDKGVGIRDDG